MATKKSAKSKETTKPEIKTMSLAVSHRPHTLKDIVGQTAAVTMVKGMRKLRRWPGAILIQGMTGGGKTTFARIIAQIINCEKQKPCGKCLSCRQGMSSPDIKVVNGGTDGKVDIMRSLVKTSRLAPHFNKRVIIIDEAHKLTGQAAEALLLDLEEPSPNTIWILCTTNPEKMLNTLTNRCTKLNMNPVAAEDALPRLLHIAKLEGVDLDTEEGKEALNLVVDFANGSMREAISLLEGLLFAVAGGADVNNQSVLKAYLQNADVDLEKAATNAVGASLDGNMPQAIRAIRLSGNARGLLYKARFLLEYLVGKETKSAKFMPYIARVFDALAKKNSIEYDLRQLLMLQKAFADVEAKMNTYPIDESVLLQVEIASYIDTYSDVEEEG